MVVQTEPSELDMKIAARSFVHSLDYVYIQEPPQPLEGRLGGRVRFEKWDYLIEAAQAFEEYKLIVLGKARQLGFSWLIAAYAAWFLWSKPGAVVLMLSKGEREAWALLAKVRFVYKNLPESWQMPLKSDGRQELSVETDDGILSKVLALPSTDDAARGETASVVLQDEAEFHESLSTNFSALEPAINAGGQIIMGSTVNKRKMTTLFREFYRGAPNNHWKKFFWGWKMRPGRDEEWYRVTKEQIPLEALEDMSPDLFMQQEYPTTEEEMLSPAAALSYFDLGILTEMLQNTYSPIGMPLDDNYRKVLHFYTARHPKGRYVGGTDIAHGKGGDYSVTVIIDLEARRVVADIMENNLRPDEFVEESIKLLKFYNYPYWGIEANAIGDEAVHAALDQDYPKNRLYFRELVKDKHSPQKKTYGWYTDRMTRPRMWGKLREWVDTGQLLIPSKDGLGQFFTVLYDESTRDFVQAMSRAHDDYPTAVAIALQMEDHVRGATKKLVVVGATW